MVDGSGDSLEKRAIEDSDRVPETGGVGGGLLNRRIQMAADARAGRTAAAVPARVVDRQPYADFAPQVRAELLRRQDMPENDIEADFRLASGREMKNKGYWEYQGRNGDVTQPQREVDIKGHRFHAQGGYYVGVAIPGRPTEPRRLYVPDPASEVYRQAAISDEGKGRVLVRFSESVSRLAMMANYDDRQRLVMENSGVAVLLMRAAIAREVGIGKNEGRKGAFGVEYILTRNLPAANQLRR